MTTPRRASQVRPSEPEVGRCRVMGILNVTPDSFSDGGRFGDAPAAIAHGLALLRPSVAAAAVDAGPTLVNDVSGGLADPDMLPFIAQVSLGFPVLVGASRKAFLAECVDHDELDAARPADRDGVSAVVASVAAATGVWAVRVHDVPAAAAASRVAARLAAARTGE